MNWKNIIQRAQDQGLTQTEIAVAVGTSQGHINDLLHGRRGSRIGFAIGQALLDMDKRMAETASEADNAKTLS
jgi:transcriptional regulator with XRE-family HTH domain